MILPSDIRFGDANIKEAFYKLGKGDSSEKDLFKFINQAMDNLEKNAFCGIQIPKDRIPKEYLTKYGAKNLWKYNLPNAWRIMYTIRSEEIIVISLLLEWMNHKDYNRRF